MAIPALTSPPSPDDAVETLLEFPDNRLLIDLCGEFDRNLAQIEQSLEVHSLRRGNQLAVMGDADARKRAAETLESLYQKLEAGRDVDAGEIDAEIRMGSNDVSETVTTEVDDDELEYRADTDPTCGCG